VNRWADGTPSGLNIPEWMAAPDVLLLHVIKHRLLAIGAYDPEVWARLWLTKAEVLQEIAAANLEAAVPFISRHGGRN